MAKKKKLNRATAAAAPTTRTEFNPDYSVTKRDLKRIGTLAGFFVLTLIALSFFIK